MSSIGQSCGVTRSFWAGNPWTSGRCSPSHSIRSAPPARRPAICSEPTAALLPPQELQASEKAENKARGCIFTSACCVSSSPSQAVEEVLPPAPTRFSGLLGGAWQKVRAMFRRSSGRADAAEEEPKAESIGDYIVISDRFRFGLFFQHRSCSHSSCQRALKPHESSCGGCRCSRPREIRGNGHAGR